MGLVIGIKEKGLINVNSWVVTGIQPGIIEYNLLEDAYGLGKL
jgi:hypothetical protein